MNTIPIIDGHIHYAHPDLMQGLMQVLDANGVARANIVCTPDQQRLSLNPDALHLKAHYPERIYVFGGLDISALFMAPQACGAQFAAYLDVLAAMGCDGVKMIEGKPDMRRMLPIPPFDGAAYAPYWARLEELGLPLIFHVNDPEEFWDAARIPQFARDAGWFYGDGTYINNEEQYAQVLNVLRRHLRLKVIFAHFFFLSAQLERLADYLDEFPNMHIDLTPGIEMYHNFACNPQAVRDFFLRYADRIVFGTDIGAKALLATPEMGIEPEESRLRLELVRGFLERDGEFRLDVEKGFLFGRFDAAFQGIGLPTDVLHKVYHGNFERLAGAQPRRVNPGAVVAECSRLLQIIPAMAAAQPGTAGDTHVAGLVRQYFLNELNR